jgi:hypothetical protein
LSLLVMSPGPSERWLRHHIRLDLLLHIRLDPLLPRFKCLLLFLHFLVVVLLVPKVKQVIDFPPGSCTYLDT